MTSPSDIPRRKLLLAVVAFLAFIGVAGFALYDLVTGITTGEVIVGYRGSARTAKAGELGFIFGLGQAALILASALGVLWIFWRAAKGRKTR